MDDRMNQILQELIIERRSETDHFELHERMHDLAEAGYEPALAFFFPFLDDVDWNWRLEGVELIGFHYEFPPDGAIANKLRQMLLTDPSDFVRISAAIVLGARSAWPDTALLQALQYDPDLAVRYAAFGAVLDLAGVPFPSMRQAKEQAVRSHTQPDLTLVKKVLQEHKIDLALPTP